VRRGDLQLQARAGHVVSPGNARLAAEKVKLSVGDFITKAVALALRKRGDQVVKDNLNCVQRGYSETQEIPDE